MDHIPLCFQISPEGEKQMGRFLFLISGAPRGQALGPLTCQPPQIFWLKIPNS